MTLIIMYISVKIGKIVWRCPYYQKWVSMLMRSYSDEYKQQYPTYQGVTVCEGVAFIYELPFMDGNSKLER